MARPIGDGRVGLRLVRGSVGIRRGERWYRGRKGAKESMDVLGNGATHPDTRGGSGRSWKHQPACICQTRLPLEYSHRQDYVSPSSSLSRQQRLSVASKPGPRPRHTQRRRRPNPSSTVPSPSTDPALSKLLELCVRLGAPPKCSMDGETVSPPFAIRPLNHPCPPTTSPAWRRTGAWI